MLRDRTSLCSRFLPARAICRAVGLLVCAPVLFCGCASSGFLSTSVYEPAAVRASESTIRSQDTPLANDWRNASSGNFAAPTPKSTQLKSNNPAEGSRNTVSAPAVGHSFAQPKARLGRPIVGLGTPVVLAEPSADATTAQRPELAPRPSPNNRTSVPQQAIWEPVQPNATPRRGPPPVPSNANSSSNQFSGSSAPPLAMDDSFPLPEQPPAAPDSQFPELPLNANTQGSLNELRGSDPEKPSTNAEATAPDDAAAEAPLTVAPTMLDRLRGLYNPRIDENTDRLRKQIRRFPDPFGLLSDRDSAEALIPSETETPPGAEGPKSADAETAAEIARPSQNNSSAVQAAITELEQQLADWPRTPSGSPQQPLEWRQRQTDLRLLYMIAGRSAESVRVIEALPEQEQEYWQSLMLSMNQYRQAGEGTQRTEQLTESLDHLRMAARKLRPLSQLAIRRMMLCGRIDGFGSVGEFPTSTFEPGQRILVYAELQNFQSELTADGKYRSEFAAVLEFMREGDDEVLDSIRVPQIEDLCDVERTDYFQSFELTLPALEGKYLMRIRLRDQLSLQTAESQLEFTVQSRN